MEGSGSFSQNPAFVAAMERVIYERTEMPVKGNDSKARKDIARGLRLLAIEAGKDYENRRAVAEVAANAVDQWLNGDFSSFGEHGGEVQQLLTQFVRDNADSFEKAQKKDTKENAPVRDHLRSMNILRNLTLILALGIGTWATGALVQAKTMRNNGPVAKATTSAPTVDKTTTTAPAPDGGEAQASPITAEELRADGQLAAMYGILLLAGFMLLNHAGGRDEDKLHRNRQYTQTEYERILHTVFGQVEYQLQKEQRAQPYAAAQL